MRFDTYRTISKEAAMRESTELKETILREAQELFAAHGYAGTSIKQIAGASGCTTAALYYYFPEGKTHILREAVHATFSDKLTTILQAGRGAASLGEWMRAFGNAALQSMRDLNRRSNWVDPEIHQLGADELAVIHQQILGFQQTIASEIERFVKDAPTAGRLAWIMMCTFSGYGQIFHSRGMDGIAEFDTAAFVETMAWMFEKAAD
jgi:AcrR family transcriptional regulator